MKQVMVASEIASLRMRLYEVLSINTKAMNHIIDYETESSTVWFAKLVDQMTICNAAGRKKQETVTHLWLN